MTDFEIQMPKTTIKPNRPVFDWKTCVFCKCAEKLTVFSPSVPELFGPDFRSVPFWKSLNIIIRPPSVHCYDCGITFRAEWPKSWIII